MDYPLNAPISPDLTKAMNSVNLTVELFAATLNSAPTMLVKRDGVCIGNIRETTSTAVMGYGPLKFSSAYTFKFANRRADTIDALLYDVARHCRQSADT